MLSTVKTLIAFCVICAVTVNAFRSLPVASRISRNNVALQSSTDGSNGNNFNKKLDKIVKSSMLAFFAAVQLASARPEGVNRPDLLPKEANVPLIDVANFLSKGQEKKITASIVDLQAKAGWKLRVLCQKYPDTPGLAIKDYWGVDDNTIVLVVDSGEGFNKKMIPTNIMNLNIGKNVDLQLPSQFWLRLTNKLGNQPYVKAKGTDVAVLNAVEAITYCLTDTEKTCKDLPFNIEF